MKRIILFLATNIAVMITLGIVANILCAVMGTTVEELIGPEYAHLAIFAFVYGFIGAIISLLLSKPMAKFACRAQVIDGSEGEAERWLVATVEDLARRANVKMPEVAIYPGAANAFATGAFRNHALVAVSSDIMGQMTKEELRAVLGRGEGSRRGNGGMYFLLVMVLDICLGILASLVVFAFSRRREYAADAGSARLLGTPSSMIAALRRLGNLQPGVLPDSLKAFGIAEGKRTSIWSTHPSLDDRIAALQNLTPGSF